MPSRQLTLVTTLGTGEEVERRVGTHLCWILNSLPEFDALPRAVGRHCVLIDFCHWFQSGSSPDKDSAMELQGHVVDPLIQAPIQCSNTQLCLRLCVCFRDLREDLPSSGSGVTDPSPRLAGSVRAPQLRGYREGQGLITWCAPGNKLAFYL